MTIRFLILLIYLIKLLYSNFSDVCFHKMYTAVNYVQLHTRFKYNHSESVSCYNKNSYECSNQCNLLEGQRFLRIDFIITFHVLEALQ